MDKLFNLNCQRWYATLIILVVVPLIIIGSMVMLIISYGKGMPDWLLIAVIALGLILSLVFTITLLSKYNSVKGLIKLNDWGIQIEFEHTTLFFPRKMYSSTWTDLRAFSSNYSDQKKTRFYKVGFRDPAINIYIDDVEYVPDSATETLFGSFALEKVNEHNRHNKLGSKIDTKNFYQGKWAKYLTKIVWMFLIFVLVFSIFFSDVIEWWRIAQFASLSGIWLATYYANTRNKN